MVTIGIKGLNLRVHFFAKNIQIWNFESKKHRFQVADPDLQIREEPGHPDHEISRGGGGGCPKNFFQSFVQQFSVTIRGGPSPGSTTGFTIYA